MGWVLVSLLAIVVLVLALRSPIGELRKHRAGKQQERKRQWRKARDEARARHAREHAMNPKKAAAKSGAPKLSQVVNDSGSKCWLCGTRTFDDDRRRQPNGNERHGATYPVVDYIVALEHGGTHELGNVRVAHQHCAQIRRANPARTQFGTPKRTYPADT